jgi:prepilin-type N-terminal cleavage/methylation domain-containing protein
VKARHAGFSLLEVVMAMVLISVGLFVTFSLFERGSRAFRLGDAKNALASDARRTVLALVPSLRVADSDTLEVLDGRSCASSSGQNVQRHGYSLAALTDWNDPASFNPDSADILWDSYRVVYANLLPLGDLIVQEYRPAPGPPYSGILPGFSEATHLANDPYLNPGALSTKNVCQSVDDFQVVFDPESQTLRLSLRLAARGAKKVGGRQLDERSEATVLVRLENSGPG